MRSLQFVCGTLYANSDADQTKDSVQWEREYQAVTKPWEGVEGGAAERRMGRGGRVR